VTIRNNAGLVDLKGLGVTHADRITVRTNLALAYVEGFSSLTSVGVLDLEENPALVDVEGLRNLGQAGSLIISGGYFADGGYDWYSRGITTLTGLRSLITADAAQISYTSATSLAGLERLTSINTLQIGYNPYLPDLGGLESLTRIGDLLEVTGNHRLVTLHGLENLTSVEHLIIYYNDMLTGFGALQSLQHLTSLEVSGNLLLPDCEARRLFVRAGGMFLTADGVNGARTCR
jgi:hypothetical protein